MRVIDKLMEQKIKINIYQLNFLIQINKCQNYAYLRRQKLTNNLPHLSH